MHKNKWVVLRRIVLPLFVGALVYLLFRPPLSLMRNIIAWEDSLISLAVLPDFLSSFVLYHLTDVLWALSFVEAIYIISKNKYLAVIIVAVFTIIFEIGQYYSIIKGTGDIWDVIFVIAMLIIYLIILHQKESIPVNKRK